MARFLEITCVVTAFALCLGCGEIRSVTYATYGDAIAAGAQRRGWLPSFVPATATDIREVHDIDTNTQWLRFAFLWEIHPWVLELNEFRSALLPAVYRNHHEPWATGSPSCVPRQSSPVAQGFRHTVTQGSAAHDVSRSYLRTDWLTLGHVSAVSPGEFK